MTDPDRIDKRTGAPGEVRMRVGAAPTPQDRLSTLRKTYPDAEPYGDDNFVFRGPGGRPTLYNPKGLDWGDLASLLPEYGEFAGGTLGGMAATLPGVLGAVPSFGASLATIPAGIGLGAAAGRYGTELAAHYLMGTDDTRNIGQRMADTAITAGTNAIGARVGEMVGPAVRGAIGPVQSALMGQSGRQVADDFASTGVRQTAGALTGNRAWQLAEKGLAATPGGARVMQDVAKMQWDDIARAAGNITKDIGTATTPQKAGSVIRTGAKKAADRFKETQDLFYKIADHYAGDKAKIVPVVTRDLADTMRSELAKAPVSRRGALQGAIDRTQGVLYDALDTRINMETWRKIRTDLGRDVDEPLLAGSTGSQNENLKRLYGAMTDDMRAAAATAGPDAKRALDIADRYTRFNMNINVPLLKKITDMGADEQAYQWAIGEAGKGGSRLLALRKNLTPDEWKVVSATVFDRLGQAAPGARGAAELGGVANDFSVSTFLTNWNKLAPEAKDALFGGRDMKGTREAIDQLARVSNRVKDVERMSGPTGTALSMLTGGSIALAGERALSGDIGGAAGILASMTVLPYVTAKMMTNPTFVRWLAGVETFGKGASRDAMIGRLAAIAEANPEIRDETLRLQQVLSSGDAGVVRR
ncbi:hypothetical protein [Reyranella sp. CPCC 100927]|uniref:hypothetical protein n=1 Tax=Reyranella sp. CPCC 100927 TaxID=2599616 RepID=UPI0011B8CEF4|nr:hypothetical protein [Reyranella sp. CPCC 100927]TWT11719.1 hypothetical protein FQU96_14690 [Reyranella sp. CPCC 100927]